DTTLATSLLRFRPIPVDSKSDCFRRGNCAGFIRSDSKSCLMKRFCPLLLSLFALVRILGADAHAPETLPLGAWAPDFKLIGVDGKKHSLKDFNTANVRVVMFTCNHCPTAQYYEERLKQIVN